MRLTVYMSNGCWVCDGVPEVLAAVSAGLPDLEVRIVDVDRAAPGDVPAAVFSVPTYTFNGAVVSLGNPSPGFVERLRALMSAGTSREEYEG